MRQEYGFEPKKFIVEKVKPYDYKKKFSKLKDKGGKKNNGKTSKNTKAEDK